MPGSTTTNLYPDVPLPAGVQWADNWQDVQSTTPWRVIKSAERRVSGCDVTVYATAVQWADGTLEHSGLDAPHVTVDGLDYYDGLTSAQARQLAAAVLNAAEQADEWFWLESAER